VGVGLRRSLRALPRAGRAGGGRLLARSLRDPEVAAWRERLLGAGAPWEPVLFAVEGRKRSGH